MYSNPSLYASSSGGHMTNGPLSYDIQLDQPAMYLQSRPADVTEYQTFHGMGKNTDQNPNMPLYGASKTKAWEDLCIHVDNYILQTGDEVAIINSIWNRHQHHYKFLVEGSSLLKQVLTQELFNIENMLKALYIEETTESWIAHHQNQNSSENYESLPTICRVPELGSRRSNSQDKREAYNRHNANDNRHYVTRDGNESLHSKANGGVSGGESLTSIESDQGCSKSLNGLSKPKRNKSEGNNVMNHGYTSTKDSNFEPDKQAESSNKTERTKPIHVNSLKNVSEEVFLCKSCEAQFKTKNLYDSHLEVDEDGETFVCETCSKVFFSSKCQKIHTLLRHCGKNCGRNAAGLFKCKVCGKNFESRTLLKNHRAEHMVSKTCICEICGGGFSNEQRLASHIWLTHACKAVSHVCDTCGRTFQTRQSLNCHIKCTHKEAHACKLCQKRFGDKSQLKAHMATHPGEKPHVCDQCGKGFSKNQYLIVHIRSHTGEKPFTCKQCEKTFASIACLNMHLTIHREEKPYSCTHCVKTFRRPYECKRHMRFHTNVRPYACSHCKKCFKDNHTRKRHIAVKHKN